MLCFLGYKSSNITIVEDGEQGLNELIQDMHKFDAVIIDMLMPKMGRLNRLLQK